MEIAVFILAGGSGIRLWPLSRKNSPKQFLPLLPENETFFRRTVSRAKMLTDISRIFVLTQEQYSETVHSQAPDIPLQNIICEPVKRNTAPVIAIAALRAKKIFGEINCIFMPSDHYISDELLFAKTVLYGVECAQRTNSTVTIGIAPDRPATCYGYIQAETADTDSSGFTKALCFKEKPELETAKQLLAKGSFLWNSGIFIWNTATIADLFRRFLPRVFCIAEEIIQADTDDAMRLLYNRMPSISIDYGILEKTDDIYVIKGLFGWNDIGSWYAIEQLYKKDENNNTAIGSSLLKNAVNCTAISRDSFTLCIDTNDLCVINTGSAVLVFPRSKAESITNIIEILEDNGLKHLL